jgi:hypothetical protein
MVFMTMGAIHECTHYLKGLLWTPIDNGYLKTPPPMGDGYCSIGYYHVIELGVEGYECRIYSLYASTFNKSDCLLN